MPALIWFNEDGLNPQHQMVQDYADAPKVYVFDVDYLQRWAIAKHRVQFIYESLLEIPNVEIYKGETVAVLRQLVTDYQVNEVVTTETPNHLIKAWQDELLKYTSLITYPEVYPTTDSRSPQTVFSLLAKVRSRLVDTVINASVERAVVKRG